MKKVVLIGPYPPPLGGVSIHLQRLIHLLNDKANFIVIDESRVKKSWPFNLRSFNLYRYYKIILSADVIHIHSGKFILRLFHILICRVILKKYTVVTLHYNPEKDILISITKHLLSLCNHSIIVSLEGYHLMLTNKKCQYHMIPAFLPPILSLEPKLPEDILAWIYNKKQQNAVLCVSNASQICIYNDQDLYGLDLCIESFKMIKSNFCLIFVIANNIPYNSLIKQYKKRINEYGLCNRILIWEKPLSFIRLIKEADIVIRATNTDGDALSIREALYFDKVVIASDVVKRPSDVYLFKNRDAIQLAITIENSKKTNNIQHKDVDYIAEYKKIYKI